MLEANAVHNTLLALSHPLTGALLQAMNYVQAVIHANLCMRLVELLTCKRDTVLVPALRTVGNIVTGTDEQTQAVLNCNALAALHSILSASTVHKKSIIKEACWTVSNITAGTREQIEAVIESGCIEPIVHLLKTGNDSSTNLWCRFSMVLVLTVLLTCAWDCYVAMHQVLCEPECHLCRKLSYFPDRYVPAALGSWFTWCGL